MDIFDGIGRGVEDLFNRAVDMGQRVNNTAKEAQKQSKLKLQIKEEQKQLEGLFTHLGEAYYMEMRDQSHRLETKAAQLLLQIDQVIEDIERLENLLKYQELMEAEKNGQKRCARCGAQLDDKAKFCSNCGAEVLDLSGPEDLIEAEVKKEKHYCLHCHYELEEGAIYCPRCGSKVEDYDPA
ncbi:MAG: zinc ribbon domain-containing protein [Tissierellia bacterium]|nr:zinc ribbon domain-containing protein [Tissierellia bacterium]